MSNFKIVAYEGQWRPSTNTGYINVTLDTDPIQYPGFPVGSPEEMSLVLGILANNTVYYNDELGSLVIARTPT